MDTAEQQLALNRAKIMIDHALYWLERNEPETVMALATHAQKKCREVAEVNDMRPVVTAPAASS